jgi:curli biogenesis system outer membrane secretion channel CsgG
MKKLFIIGLVLLSFGCIRVHSYAKPDVNFSTLKRVALIKFGVHDVPLVAFKSQSSQKSESQGSTKSESEGTINISPQNESLSKMVTDAMTLAFIKKGFNVIDKNQLKKIIDENLIIQSGLTEEIRNSLALAKIDVAVIGNVVVKRKLLGEDMSLSLNMYDVRSGDLLWTANVVEFDFDEINKVAEKMAETIP